MQLLHKWTGLNVVALSAFTLYVVQYPEYDQDIKYAEYGRIRDMPHIRDTELHINALIYDHFRATT